jgi:hypothetical protein
MNLYTDTWEYPEPEKRVSPTIYIKRGNGCKIKNHSGEKFWVTFIKEEKGVYFGMVNNILFKKSPYNIGDLVAFRRNHIWDVMTPERRERESKKIKKIINEYHAIHKRTPTMLEIIKIEKGEEIALGIDPK